MIITGGSIIFYLLIILLCTLLAFFVKWKLSRQHLYKLAAKVPLVNLPSLPFIGHGLAFVGSTEYILKRLLQCTGKTSPPRAVWLGHKLFFTINRAEDLEVVLNKCLYKDDAYKLLTTIVGDGLVTMDVPEWRRHRKAILPTFNQMILDQFVEVFMNQSEILLQQLDKKVGQQVNFIHYANRYGLDTVCETAMGISINAQTTDSKIEKAVNMLMEIIMRKMFFIPFQIDWIYKFTRTSKIEQKYSKVYYDFIIEVIQIKLAKYRKEMEAKKDMVLVEEKEKYIFMDLLIELSEKGGHWTNEEILAEVGTFMVGGSDTGATVSSFTLLMLGIHQDIQQKCYEEALEILGPDRRIEHTDLPKFVYLEQVIKESMRLFPVAPIIVRKVHEDVEVGGYVLPKNAGLVLSIISLHRSEVYYENPMKFDPGRWTPENTAKRHKYSYLAFSGGPRNCIGPKYGMMSLKTLLATILRKYRVETHYKDLSEIRIRQAIVLKAVEGIPLTFIPRD